MEKSFKQFKETLSGNLPELDGIVNGMDEETFDSLYGSLSECDQKALNNHSDMINHAHMCIKLVGRYMDVANHHTDMGEDGVLLVTPGSTILELPIDATTYARLSTYGITSIDEAIHAELPEPDLMETVAEAYTLLKDSQYPKLVEVLP